MKNVINTFFLLLALLPAALFAQVKVGDNPAVIDGSAILEVESTNQGFLPPRMTEAQMNAIVSPAEGLMAYCTDCSPKDVYFFEGTSWVPMSGPSQVLGSTLSLDCAGAVQTGRLMPGEPASGVSAAVSYTGGNGGVHNGQTVSSTGVTGLTASLGSGLFADGSGSLVYTITGTASGNGLASFALDIGGQSCALVLPVGCGAYVAAGVWKTFLCHNLGADPSADPFAPSWRLNGDYYQWGRNPACFGIDGTDGANPCSAPVYGAAAPWGNAAVNDNAGAIPGWSTTVVPDGSWQDEVKTANDPCPAGFRVPTKAQWDGVLASNGTLQYLGDWMSSTTNYSSGLQVGHNLFLPSTGSGRDGSNGMLVTRGSRGSYWSSTENTSSFAWPLLFQNGNANTSYPIGYRHEGRSIRCIAE
ncbi:fibrobacter succinogenes major paralogous domain-containing protein [Phaeodactylibacter luteus]|uniref:Uncharacterized protein n=1 Tax=Phaeodactylibacter luteus TaxID=1564516 RepID=A0A5C6RGC2_9BACT|nr:FISUMP domain-containing protein [Phaeodactylibacter luteus]TXB61321.1 hypothetical protein FRY97_19745 [Phaeodactylibacter luteus]